MKKGMAIACYVLFGAWIAFDPFSKTPIHSDPVGKVFGYISGAMFVVILSWNSLRKTPDDHPNW